MSRGMTGKMTRKMKRLPAFVFVLLAVVAAHPAHAFLGFGDVTYDPQNYAEITKLYEQTKSMYDTAMKQLDSMANVERSIRDAQQAYDSLATFSLKQAAAGLTPDGSNMKTIAGLRDELARTGGGLSQNTGFVQYQLSQIRQLENLDLLQKASSTNVSDSTNKNSQADTGRITAQSTSALASLAAAEQQRKTQEDYARAAAAQGEADNFGNAGKVYEAIGK